MKPCFVLDSHALLAFLRGEPSGSMVAAHLQRANESSSPLLMTEVNYAEVNYMILRKDGAAAWALVKRELRALPIDFYPADRSLAQWAADFKSRFRLSLADAFAAALAKERGAKLITGAPEFKPLEAEIPIEWIK